MYLYNCSYILSVLNSKHFFVWQYGEQFQKKSEGKTKAVLKAYCRQSKFSSRNFIKSVSIKYEGYVFSQRNSRESKTPDTELNFRWFLPHDCNVINLVVEETWVKLCALLNIERSVKMFDTEREPQAEFSLTVRIFMKQADMLKEGKASQYAPHAE